MAANAPNRAAKEFTHISCTFGMMPTAFGPVLPATAISQLATKQIRKNNPRFRTRNARRYTIYVGRVKSVAANPPFPGTFSCYLVSTFYAYSLL